MPASHKQAASFTTYRTFVPKKLEQGHHQDASSIVLAMIHDPFLKLVDSSEQKLTLQLCRLLVPWLPVRNLRLSSFLRYCHRFWHLCISCRTTLLSTRLLTTYINRLLLSWGKIVDQPEGLNELWSILEVGKSSTTQMGSFGDLNCESQFFGLHFFLILEAEPFIIVNSDAQRNSRCWLRCWHDFHTDPAHFVNFLTTIFFFFCGS